jgi:hypothetical protein
MVSSQQPLRDATVAAIAIDIVDRATILFLCFMVGYPFCDVVDGLPVG